MRSVSPLKADEVGVAIAQSNIQNLIELLKSGADPNGLNENGLPHLLVAWQLGDIGAFEVLQEMARTPIKYSLKINRSS